MVATLWYLCRLSTLISLPVCQARRGASCPPRPRRPRPRRRRPPMPRRLLLPRRHLPRHLLRPLLLLLPRLILYLPRPRLLLHPPPDRLPLARHPSPTCSPRGRPSCHH